MTKAELEKKKKLARTLYMAGKDQNEIADQIDISRQTLSKWANQEGWKEQRAATSVTRPELVNKLLHSIDTLITDVNASGDAAKIAGLLKTFNYYQDLFISDKMQNGFSCDL